MRLFVVLPKYRGCPRSATRAVVSRVHSSRHGPEPRLILCLLVVPRQRCVHAATGQSIELSFAKFAELRGVASIAEVGAQQRNREHPEAITNRRIDDRVHRRDCIVQLSHACSRFAVCRIRSISTAAAWSTCRSIRQRRSRRHELFRRADRTARPPDMPSDHDCTCGSSCRIGDTRPQWRGCPQTTLDRRRRDRVREGTRGEVFN